MIRDGDVVLRLWSVDDRAAVDNIVASSQFELNGWLPGLVSELLDFDEFVERVRRCASEGTGWYYAVEVDACVVGQCSIEVLGERTGEIGYWVRSDRTNERIATQAASALCRAVIAHGFARLFIHCDEGNLGSKAIARKLGFTHLDTVDLDAELPRTDVQTGREMSWMLLVEK